MNMTIEKWIQFIKAHEKLIIVCLGVWFAFHLYGDVLNSWIDHDKRNIALQTTVAQTAAQKTEADSVQNQQLAQQLADMKLQYATLSAQLTASMQVRAVATQTQKQKNDQSTPSVVASRITDILHVGPNQVVSNVGDDGLTFTAAAAHVNVNALEDGLKAEADVLDLNKQLAGCIAINKIEEDTTVGVRKELADEKLSHIADVKLEQDKTKLAVDNGKKQFRKGFIFGFVTGFVGGIITGHKF